MFAQTIDHTALKVGNAAIGALIPVVGSAATAALQATAASLHLVKGGLALAAIVAFSGAFLPAFLQCILFRAVFALAGILASGTGQRRCSLLCRLFAEGIGICLAVLMLYFFLLLLSTILLFLLGNGGS